ncbi:MAG: CoA transferase, partial [Trueperaceae bacterium]|nr:CoA transferase [Trueperaceae bacterium]
VAALGLVVEYQHPDFGAVRQVAGPVHTSQGTRVPVRASALGEDTVSVLQDLVGMTTTELDELVAEGVVA